MRLVSKILQQPMKANNHLIKDSRIMINMRLTTQSPHDVCCMKFDISEFFMSGVHSELAEHASSIVDPSIRSDFMHLIEVIIGSQYVAMPGDKNHIVQVKRGTGMGFVCSGEASDTVFLCLAELPWAVDANAQKPFGISGYWRFKDDGLIMIRGSTQSRMEGFSKFKALAGVFKVTLEVFSRSEVTFLGLRIFKGPKFFKSRFLDFELFVKPTNIWVPLSAPGCDGLSCDGALSDL